MGNDELLVLAAKACGMPKPVDDNGVWSAWVGTLENGHWWNPLEEDGDAFQLMLKLQIKIEYVPEMDSVMCSLPGSMGATSVSAIGDIELRYAIVQVAAQYGLAMP